MAKGARETEFAGDPMRVNAVRRATQPATETFADRAFQLVAFLAERVESDVMAPVRRERELSDWICRWQQGEPTSQHFIDVELSIILRALLGPRARSPDSGSDCRRLCSVVADCMAHDA